MSSLNIPAIIIRYWKIINCNIIFTCIKCATHRIHCIWDIKITMNELHSMHQGRQNCVTLFEETSIKSNIYKFYKKDCCHWLGRHSETSTCSNMTMLLVTGPVQCRISWKERTSTICQLFLLTWTQQRTFGSNYHADGWTGLPSRPSRPKWLLHFGRNGLEFPRSSWSGPSWRIAPKNSGFVASSKRSYSILMIKLIEDSLSLCQNSSSLIHNLPLCYRPWFNQPLNTCRKSQRTWWLFSLFLTVLRMKFEWTKIVGIMGYKFIYIPNQTKYGKYKWWSV